MHAGDWGVNRKRDRRVRGETSCSETQETEAKHKLIWGFEESGYRAGFHRQSRRGVGCAGQARGIPGMKRSVKI